MCEDRKESRMLQPGWESSGTLETEVQEHLPLEDSWLWSQWTSDLMSMPVWEYLHEFVRFLLWPPPQQVGTDTKTVKVVARNEGIASTDEEAHVTYHPHTLLGWMPPQESQLRSSSLQTPYCHSNHTLDHPELCPVMLLSEAMGQDTSAKHRHLQICHLC